MTSSIARGNNRPADGDQSLLALNLTTCWLIPSVEAPDHQVSPGRHVGTLSQGFHEAVQLSAASQTWLRARRSSHGPRFSCSSCGAPYLAAVFLCFMTEMQQTRSKLREARSLVEMQLPPHKINITKRPGRGLICKLETLKVCRVSFPASAEPVTIVQPSS